MIKQLPIVATLFSSVLLGGCGINQPTPEMKYHLLDHDNRGLNHRLPDNKIAVNKVKLADYLMLPNLVMRVSSNKLDLAAYHSWAEPMDDAIQRILISELNQINSEHGFVKQCRNCTQFNVFIEHFYPDQEGKVVLSGHVTVEANGREPLVEYFSFSKEQAGAGYSESVKVMNNLLVELSNKLQKISTYKL